MSFARFSTDDTRGQDARLRRRRRFTDDPLNTFGGAGVVEFRRLQKLLRYICERGFEHHVAANLCHGRRRPCTKPPPVIWAGICTATNRR